MNNNIKVLRKNLMATKEFDALKNAINERRSTALKKAAAVLMWAVRIFIGLYLMAFAVILLYHSLHEIFRRSKEKKEIIRKAFTSKIDDEINEEKTSVETPFGKVYHSAEEYKNDHTSETVEVPVRIRDANPEDIPLAK